MKYLSLNSFVFGISFILSSFHLKTTWHLESESNFIHSLSFDVLPDLILKFWRSQSVSVNKNYLQWGWLTAKIPLECFLINFLDKASSVTHVVEKTLINYKLTINSQVTDCFVYLCFCDLFFKVDKCNIIHVWNEFVSFLGLILELINNIKFHLLLSVSFSILLMLLLFSSLFSLK